VIGVAVALVVAAAIPVTLVIRYRQAVDRLHSAVAGFAAAWQAGTLDKVAYRGAIGADVAKQAATVTAGLTDAATDRPAAVTVLGVDGPNGDSGTGRVRVRWQLAPGRSWQYDTSARFRDDAGAWKLEWSPSVVHPQLGAGQVLTTTRTPAGRGQIVGARGEVLVAERSVVTVGIQPNRTTDKAGTAAAVAAAVNVDATALTKRVLAAAPTAFVEVITLRQTDYQALRDRLQPIPGAVFQQSSRALAPSAGFARSLLGTVGTATKEVVDASQGRVRAGEVTGLSGIQRTYDAQLSGTPGLSVRAAPAGGSGTGTVLFSAAPVDGATVTLSLDATVQKAAEAALAGAPKPAGLVAIRPSTGEVLAIANGPAGADGYDRALIGRYPPGSTFKVATGFALLQAGVTPTTPVACPATINVGGRSFTNAEGEVLGTVPFHTDFAQSCNTAFVGSSQKITAQQLFDAASSLGYGQPNRLGVDAFTGSVPRQAGAVEHAADAIGQGTVLASPLTVASVSASVAAGRYLPPRLVLGVASPATAGSTGTPSAGTTSTGTPQGGSASTGTESAASDTNPSSGAASSAAAPSGTASSGTASSAAGQGTPLSAAAIANLRTLMAEVVTSGTGTALRGVPGGPVHGKTGTAEFGSATPPLTHAWFTGYQGDLAFAVVVEGGGFGGKVAAPLAASFLTKLH
jgi:cell division protein FtsI/penicillin-binding protein 2